MSWKAVGKPTVRQQRGKWVVRVDGIDTSTASKLPRQLGAFPSQRAARNAASKFIADGAEQAERGNVSWAVDRWLASKSDVSAKSRSQYESAARDIREGLGGVPLEHLDRTDVAAWLDGVAAGGVLSRRSIQILRTVLRAALADAVDEGALRRSPANRVALPKDVVKAGLEREQPARPRNRLRPRRRPRPRYRRQADQIACRLRPCRCPRGQLTKTRLPPLDFVSSQPTRGSIRG